MRRRPAGLVFALGLAVVVVVAQGAAARGRPLCLVSNERTGLGVRTLQAAVDAAESGDTLVVKGTCVGTTSIVKTITLEGVANKPFGVPTLDGDQRGPVLLLAGPSVVTVRSLTIRNGIGGIADGGAGPDALMLENSTVSGNAGVGIFLESVGRVSIVDSTIADNSGRGIFVVNSSRAVVVTGSTVSGNRGGGIGLADGNLDVTDSSISRNSAQLGGGILGVDGTALLTDSTVSGNRAEQGGGVHLDPPFALVLAGTSSVTGNTADLAGGGVFATISEANPIGIDLTGAEAVVGNTPDNCYPSVGPLAACPA